MNKMNIYQKLLNVQKKMKCNKNKYNEFAGFYYRSCEDILDNVKPLLFEEHLLLILTDEEKVIGENRYIRATATVYDTDEPNCDISVSALAREDDARAKMSNSQLTGSASSYARKYALNGLFLLDDVKDSDTNEYHKSFEDNKTTQHGKMLCETCGTEIKSQKSIDYYKKHENAKVLCFNCNKKRIGEVIE